MNFLEEYLKQFNALWYCRNKKALEKKVGFQDKEMCLHEMIELLVAQGYSLQENIRPDHRTTDSLQRELWRQRQSAPLGNPNHPMVRRIQELEKLLSQPIMIREKRMILGSSFYHEKFFGKIGIRYIEWFQEKS